MTAREAMHAAMTNAPRERQVALALGLAFNLSVGARGAYSEPTTQRLSAFSELIHRVLSFLVEMDAGIDGRDGPALLVVLEEQAKLGGCLEDLAWSYERALENRTDQ